MNEEVQKRRDFLEVLPLPLSIALPPLPPPPLPLTSTRFSRRARVGGHELPSTSAQEMFKQALSDATVGLGVFFLIPVDVFAKDERLQYRVQWYGSIRCKIKCNDSNRISRY